MGQISLFSKSQKRSYVQAKTDQLSSDNQVCVRIRSLVCPLPIKGSEHKYIVRVIQKKSKSLGISGLFTQYPSKTLYGDSNKCLEFCLLVVCLSKPQKVFCMESKSPRKININTLCFISCAIMIQHFHLKISKNDK